MPTSSFFEKKEIFERGVAEVRTALHGRDVATIPKAECGVLYKQYETLATLAKELCELSRTASAKEQYSAYALRLSERASTLKALASGKSPKATSDEKRRQMLEEFDKRTQDIKKRLRSRTMEELTSAECETLAKKYEKLALLAHSIADMARTEADEQKYNEFYEKLMCRVAELQVLARKKSKKAKVPPSPKKAEKKSDEVVTAQPPSQEVAQDVPTRESRLAKVKSTASTIFLEYEQLIRDYQSLESTALSDEEREEYAYFIRYFTESAEFFEAVRKKEIPLLSPDEILEAK